MLSRFDYAALAAAVLLVAALFLLIGCQDPKNYPSPRPQSVNPCAYPDCKSRLYKKPVPPQETRPG